MLRAIITAILSALKSIGRFAGRIVAAPFAALGAMAGGDVAAAPPLIELPPPIEAATNDNSEVYKRIADAILRWACTSVIDDRPAPLPPGLPLAVRAWLPGLSREECEAIVESEPNDVLAHFNGISPIIGVRSVQSLAAVSEWAVRDSKPAQQEVSSPPLSAPASYGAR
ncbi:hypothetical protein V1291_003602 [Nitrobacteraceae bacterium AZCC 1564]